MDMRKTIITFLLMAVCSLQAQNLTIKSLTLLADDNTAIEKQVLDNRQNPCALIKVETGGLKGLLFPNKGRDHKENTYDEQTGQYLVYIPAAIKKLTYSHPDYLSGEIIFGDYVGKLEAGKTYLLTIETPVNAMSGSVVVIKVNPMDASVVFDGKAATPTDDGVYEFTVQPGSYAYSISAPDHLTQKGTASVEQGETKTLSKKLLWIRHDVNMRCNVSDAQVYVDNTFYGKVGKLSLPQGKHNIRIKAPKYLDVEEQVTIKANMPELSYTLKKNKNVKDVHAVDVIIYSLHQSSKMYKNQKRIKEWTNGATIKFMPGTYYLTDDDYNEYKLVVKEGSAPMTVKF